jgi:hypothetical protein
MNWIEIVSLLASFASIAAFLLFIYFSLTLWLKKRELSKRIGAQSRWRRMQQEWRDWRSS